MRKVVLVVEGDSTRRQLLAQRIRLAGLTAVAARTWAEAVHFVRLGKAVMLLVLGPSFPLTEGCSERDLAEIPIVALPAIDPCGALAETLANYGYAALQAGDGEAAAAVLTGTFRPVDVVMSSCSTTGCPIRHACTSSRGSGSCRLDARAF
jgi:hypothetical protein